MTKLESRNFILFFRNGDEAELEFDIEGEVFYHAEKSFVKKLTLSNFKLYSMPSRFLMDEEIQSLKDLEGLTSRYDLDIIREVAERLLIRYGCELMEFNEKY